MPGGNTSMPNPVLLAVTKRTALERKSKTNKPNQWSRWVLMSCVTLQFCFTPWSCSSIRHWSSVDRNVWLCIPARAYVRQEAGVNNNVHVCYLCGNMATVVAHKVYCLAEQREAPDETVGQDVPNKESSNNAVFQGHEMMMMTALLLRPTRFRKEIA